MKSLKILVASLLIVAAAGTLFAFSNPKETVTVDSKRAVVFYQYIGTQPPTAASIALLANWQLVPSDPCNHAGTKLCAIRFDNTQYTLAQAIAKVPALGSSYVDGTNVGTVAAPIIILTKS